MVSVGMVINKQGLGGEAEFDSIKIKELKLPGGLVETRCYLGLDNTIQDEIHTHFRVRKLRLNFRDYEMVLTTAEGEMVLEPHRHVEHYMKLVTDDTSATIRPIRAAEEPVK